MEYFAIWPSNQRNIASGDPAGPLTPGSTYEQDIWYIGAQEAKAEIERQGYVAKIFYERGVGSDTYDELHPEFHEGMDWLKQYPKANRHGFSLHSNAGAGIQYMYMLYGLKLDLGFAASTGRNAAARTGFIYRSPAYRGVGATRPLGYFLHTADLGLGRTLLFETGEHQTSVSAAYLWRYARFLGIMCARAFIQASGLPLLSDGPVSSDVLVPPGTQFDKYRPQIIDPPIPPPPVITLPVVKLTVPLMRDSTVGDFATSYKITQYPIHWLQDGLAEHVYKQGPIYTYVDRNGVEMTADITNLARDGIAGWQTIGAFNHFAKEHYWAGGQHMVADSQVDANDWEKMRIVM